MTRRTRTAIAAIAAFITVAVLRAAAPVAAQQEPLKTWSKVIPNAAQRFKVLSGFGNQAVLDRETGLVWERAPATSCFEAKDVVAHCANLEVGGRKGWHVPTVEQLASLLDTSVAGSPKLPSGHPFLGIHPDGFYYTNSAASVVFGDGSVIFLAGPGCTDGCCGTEHLWCVRGGEL